MALPQSAQRFFYACVAALLGACSSSHNSVVPQAPQSFSRESQVVAPADELAQQLPDQSATTTGPIVYISDVNTKLWTVNLTTKAVHFVGFTGPALSDLGFDPINHVLYGVTFTTFYRVSTVTGRATMVGFLGIADANALVFDARGRGYTKGFMDTQLYTINNVATGRVTRIGSTGAWKSAGDLTFYNKALVLSGFTGANPYLLDSLVFLNRSTGAVLSVRATNLKILYGLVSTGPNLLFGFANTSLYRLFPSASTVAGRAVLIKNLAPNGVGQIFGAAFNGNFQ